MNSISKSEIKSFLDEFKIKMKTFGVIFKDREKNLQALLDLEITAIERNEHLLNLKVEDYYGGPKTDSYDPESLSFWEFGITLKKTQVYIKISLWKSKKVLCISFHPAERKMIFPYK